LGFAAAQRKRHRAPGLTDSLVRSESSQVGCSRQTCDSGEPIKA
jgi:hypothetical protein